MTAPALETRAGAAWSFQERSSSTRNDQIAGLHPDAGHVVEALTCDVEAGDAAKRNQHGPDFGAQIYARTEVHVWLGDRSRWRARLDPRRDERKAHVGAAAEVEVHALTRRVEPGQPLADVETGGAPGRSPRARCGLAQGE